jgi:hypothetical protein
MSAERTNGDNLHCLVGFRLLARVCGKQSRKPTVCHHPDNPGTLGLFGGGKCVKRLCPVWSDLQKANDSITGGR